MCVGSYNKHIGGVDKLDQLRSYYGVGRAGRRWWRYRFWGILNVGLINAYILWVVANRPLSANTRLFGLKAFKLKLVHDLCDRQPDHREFRSRRQPAATDNLTIEQVITDNVVDGACPSEVGRQGEHLPHVLPFVAEDVAWMPCRVQLRLRHLQGVSLPTRHLFPGLSSAPLND